MSKKSAPSSFAPTPDFWDAPSDEEEEDWEDLDEDGEDFLDAEDDDATGGEFRAYEGSDDDENEEFVVQEDEDGEDDGNFEEEGDYEEVERRKLERQMKAQEAIYDEPNVIRPIATAFELVGNAVPKISGKKEWKGQLPDTFFSNEKLRWKSVNVDNGMIAHDTEGGFFGLEELDASSLIIEGDERKGFMMRTKSEQDAKKNQKEKMNVPAKEEANPEAMELEGEKKLTKKEKQKEKKEQQKAEAEVNKNNKRSLDEAKGENAQSKKAKKAEPIVVEDEPEAEQEQEESMEETEIQIKQEEGLEDEEGDDSTNFLMERLMAGDSLKAAKKAARLQSISGESHTQFTLSEEGREWHDKSGWRAFELNDSIVEGLRELNFDMPTLVQKTTMGSSLYGSDIIAAAHTGSGKTLAYGLPIVQRMLQRPWPAPPASANKASGRGVRALILVPTRELAVQVGRHLGAITKQTNLKTCCLVGGLLDARQERLLSRNPDIVIATPGRLWDLISRNADGLQHLYRIEFLVLDEADRMIQTGRFPQLTSIVDLINRDPDAFGIKPMEKEKEDDSMEFEVKKEEEQEHEQEESEHGEDEEKPAKKKSKSSAHTISKFNRSRQIFLLSATLSLPDRYRRKVSQFLKSVQSDKKKGKKQDRNQDKDTKKGRKNQQQHQHNDDAESEVEAIGKLLDLLYKSEGTDGKTVVRRFPKVFDLNDVDEQQRLLAEAEALESSSFAKISGSSSSSKKTGILALDMQPSVMSAKKKQQMQGITVVGLGVSPTLKQYKLQCLDEEKDDYLYYLLGTEGVRSEAAAAAGSESLRVLVFCSTAATVRRVAQLLQTLQLDAIQIHGDLNQGARLAAIDKFRAKPSSILVGTDVAARGLDFPEVHLVIQYNVVKTTETYIHRCGRTARAGRPGACVSILSPGDDALFKPIERAINKAAAEAQGKAGACVITGFPVDLMLMKDISKRIQKARNIQRVADEMNKERVDSSWEEKMAAEMDMDLEKPYRKYDPEDAANEKRAKKLQQKGLRALRDELNAMLKQPLLPSNLKIKKKFVSSQIATLAKIHNAHDKKKLAASSSAADASSSAAVASADARPVTFSAGAPAGINKIMIGKMQKSLKSKKDKVVLNGPKATLITTKTGKVAPVYGWKKSKA